MPNALILTAPQRIAKPLPNTPKLWLPGDRRVVTSDTFTGTTANTLAGRSTDAKLGGVAESWSASVPAAFGVASGRLVPGALAQDSFAAVSRPSGSVEVSTVIHSVTGGLIWLAAIRDALTGAANQARLAINTTTAIISITEGGANTTLGSAHAYTPGQRIAMRVDGLKVEMLIAGAVVETQTLPRLIPGTFTGVARSGQATFSLSNFTVDTYVG